MKEYWINVYYFKGRQWQGFCYPTKEPRLNVRVLYRIHVRMK